MCKSNPKKNYDFAHDFLKTVPIILFSDNISFILIQENEDLNTTNLHVIVMIF